MAEIKFENVSFIYSEKSIFEVKALKNVDLTVEDKKITGIIGHTGSGKSTLVSMVNGLTKPTSGRVLIDGEDIYEKKNDMQKLRFRVGLVMQYPEYQLFEDTVGDDIAFGPKNMGCDKEEIKNRVLEAAAFVGLTPDMLDHSPFDMSGGQKRRAAIAGVMAMRPEVLVLDEPAAGLDPIGRRSIFEAISKYAKSRNATVIIVSHSMEDMAKYCDNIVVMSCGQVEMSGKCDEVFSNADKLRAIGLDIPEITRIMLKLRKKGMDVSTSVYSVDRAVLEIGRAFKTHMTEGKNSH